MKKLYALCLILIFTFSCIPTDDNTDDGPDPGSESLPEEFDSTEIANLQAIIMDELTKGESKTWFFDGAIFDSEQGEIDVSNLENVTDDEFIFHKLKDSEATNRGLLEWRPGITYPSDASTIEELSQGTYQAPIFLEFEIGIPSEGKRTVPNEIRIIFDESTLSNKNGESQTSKSNTGWRWKYWYGNVDTIEEYLARTFSPKFFPPRDCSNLAAFNLNRWYMTPAAKEAERLRLCAREKLPEDYTNNLAADLVFEEEFSFFSNSVDYWSAMTGSEVSSSIYIAIDERSAYENGIRPERVIKYNVNTKEIKESLFFQEADDDKSAHVVGNNLYVVGPRFINKYDLNLNSLPTSFDNSGDSKRFFDKQTSATSSDLLIVGGSTWNDPDGDGNGSWYGDDPEGIYKWSLETNFLTKIGEGQFSFGDPAVVGTKLYFLSGEKYSEYFDLNSNSLHTFETLNEVPFVRYSFPYENRIFLVSWRHEENKPVLGTYDVYYRVFSEFSTNLSRPNLENIYGMCIIKGRIYIVYGERQPSEIVRWQVLSASLGN